MSLITEPPEAGHKSNARSSHYCAGKHMVSGIFRFYCPVAHGRNEGWGHGDLTIMRNPEDVAQWRASERHVIYSSRLSPPCLIETPEMCCKLRSRGFFFVCFCFPVSFNVAQSTYFAVGFYQNLFSRKQFHSWKIIR